MDLLPSSVASDRARLRSARLSIGSCVIGWMVQKYGDNSSISNVSFLNINCISGLISYGDV